MIAWFKSATRIEKIVSIALIVLVFSFFCFVPMMVAGEVATVGFGKTVEHNLSLIKRLDEFLELDKPVLMGVSRKSTIGTLTGKPVDQRLSGSIALTALCGQSGAKIIRTHDVAETVDAITITTAVMNAG